LNPPLVALDAMGWRIENRESASKVGQEVESAPDLGLYMCG
jgi:hypothetical protein